MTDCEIHPHKYMYLSHSAAHPSAVRFIEIDRSLLRRVRETLNSKHGKEVSKIYTERKFSRSSAADNC